VATTSSAQSGNPGDLDRPDDQLAYGAVVIDAVRSYVALRGDIDIQTAAQHVSAAGSLMESSVEPVNTGR